MRYNEEFISDLEKLRMKVELNPAKYKKLKDYHTHGLPCDLEDGAIKSMNKIISKWIRISGKESVEFMSLMKAAVGVEYDTIEIKKIYKESGEIPPAYDLSLRAICADEEVTNILNNFLYKGILPDNFKNCKRFIKKAKARAKKYIEIRQDKPRVGKLVNGTSTRIKNKYNVCDIVGVAYHTVGYEKKRPNRLLNRLNVIRKPYWDYLEFIPQIEETYGRHFVVPGKEGKILREVYNMDPCVQLDGTVIADYLRYIAKGFDANATLDQYKWIWKCIDNEWNIRFWIASTDMDKYSDSLNRIKLTLLLYRLGIIELEEIEELNTNWGLDVWDEDLNQALRNSDSVKQGQYAIFDAMTIANMFAQEIVYDLLGEDSEYFDSSRNEMRSKNSALGDDTVLAFINEQPKGLETIQYVFGYLGVKISLSKTHIMSRGYNYTDHQTEDYGFVDFAKRIVNRNGLIPYISVNAIEKNNFDDYVMEYFRILAEDEELAEQFGKQFLKDRFLFIKNLHKINGGRRIDKITDDDMILFEYKTNLIRSRSNVSPHEIRKQLQFIKDQGLLLSNTPLVGWLPDYNGDDLYVPSEDDDEIIISRIMNYHSTGIDIDFIPSDYIGKTWEEVKDDDVFNNILMTMRIDEKNKMARSRKSNVYDKMSKLKLSEFRHNLFIFESSITNENGYRDYTDMRNEAFVKKMHISFSRVCRLKKITIYEDKCWYWDNRYVLRYNGIDYRLYNLQRVRYNSKPIISKEVFSELCKDIYVNKDIDDIYRLFIDSLPYLSRNDDYYCYFEF